MGEQTDEQDYECGEEDVTEAIHRSITERVIERSETHYFVLEYTMNMQRNANE